MIDVTFWLNETSLNAWMVTRFWSIPIIQCIHIAAIAASFSSILMINARMFGFAGSGTMLETSRRYLKVLWWSLLVLVLSGSLMIVAEPIRELINPFFWIKMGLLLFAVLFTVAFSRGILLRIGPNDELGAGGKASVLLLIVLWILIMFCGRWIAYAPV
ncbi:MAG: hypothetical protein B7Z08_05680 [Sphingomonadales bacterium 32-68-7]|nr:MAG: hypothetical protein B7Z33_06095 [Sphingomonadales bacterium 12-68-11]OYX09334.1 MAG: hypothetical protein B7Z08_05680 [Sphingomonadales bacterium 32-68-7]